MILGEQKVLKAMTFYDIMHKIRRPVLLGGWKFIFSEVTNTYTFITNEGNIFMTAYVIRYKFRFHNKAKF